ncbi:MAG: nickel-dependent hydrogenase large subunit [Nitrospiraceae bacterium]|nr:MAG: nickel-dependent hydrogenase large subunit [Nitrospiraceae bacterium]
MKKRINVDYLSRVEGEGALTIELSGGRADRIDLRIFEAPRFFEPILRGRPFQEVIDFTARICGICPVAYQMSAVHAIESAMGVPVPDSIKDLRRLMYCGEWIESHALHVHFLHGPDFYGMESAWSKKEYLHITQRGMKLKRLGNEILALLGGRAVHPVSVRPGGFFRIPDKARLHKLMDDLERGLESALESIAWAASLFDEDRAAGESAPLFISLHDPDTYPMIYGRVCASDGSSYTADEFAECIEEYQVPLSTALHAGVRSGTELRPFVVGPLARINLNYRALPEEILSAAQGAGVALPLHDMRKSIIARCIETGFAIHEAMAIIKRYNGAERHVEVHQGQGRGVWITEAPRGMLLHAYEFDRKGNTVTARIIPPTSQNLAHIEKSLREFINGNGALPVKDLRRGCEQVIRSYDPCISCSVHIIDLSDSSRRGQRHA